MTKLEWMERFAHSFANAMKYTDSTVWVNERAPSIARKKLEQLGDTQLLPVLFGVKDTEQISLEFVKSLAEAPDFVWLTLDRMAPHGRALDPDLTNPLTGRLMTRFIKRRRLKHPARGA